MRQSWTPLSISALLTIAAAASQISLHPASHSQDYKFDALLHLPGISPYFDAIGFGLQHKAPLDCHVTVATYLVRHAAIYANDYDYEEFIEPFLKKLDSTYPSSSSSSLYHRYINAITDKLSGRKREGWTGSLSFFSKWRTPITSPSTQLEKITPQGFKDAKKVGKHLLSLYPELVPTMKRIYADKKSRTQDTAKAFIQAFPQAVEIHEITTNGSFHSQIPHKHCGAFSKKEGDVELGEFMDYYTPPIMARLQPFSPVVLEPNDIVGLQQLCGYESAITGRKSLICDVFTDYEWMAYEYAWDLKYSHMVGYGNALSPYLGMPWLNTTASLMGKFHKPRHTNSTSSNHMDDRENDDGDDDGKIPDDDGQRFFLSFTHREVPPFIVTALGLFNSSNSHQDEFPTDRINWARAWKMADLIPFLGHVGVEKLTCSVPAPTNDKGNRDDEREIKEYIRVITNSAPRPIPSCQNGPGASCKMDDFVAIVKKGMEEYGDFDGVCGNGDDEDPGMEGPDPKHHKGGKSGKSGKGGKGSKGSKGLENHLGEEKDGSGKRRGNEDGRGEL